MVAAWPAAHRVPVACHGCRHPRIDLPGIAQHIVQRGNERQPCFLYPGDYQRNLQDLRELCLQQRCHLHAWVLMTNHVHLLLTPQASGAGEPADAVPGAALCALHQ